MLLQKDAVINAIIKVLNHIQKEVGYPPEKISSTTIPIGGLPHFDSLAAVSTTVHCFKELNIEKKGEKIANLFMEKKKGVGMVALSVEQIADRIQKL